MLKNYFIHLFKYNDWATRAAADSVKGLENKDERLIELLSHIVSAQKLWLNRILGRDMHINPWEKITMQECVDQSTIVTGEWINMLESYTDDDLDTRIEYKNTKGETHINTVKDIVTQVLNHSTYHRAQIASLIRQAGGEPAKTDYIVYQREFQK
jgi:uncharacterized damage-inducible protein DinB